MSVENVLITGGAGFTGSHLADDVALVRALERLAQDPALRADLGLRARQQAEPYSAAVMVDLTPDVHARALSRTRSKGRMLRCA